MPRRLAAILAADVVGYSKLMAEDEAGTLAALKAHRRDLFDPETERHGGRIVKLMGDGVLVEFPSVVDAVDCAVAILSALTTSDGKISLRIGINLGDIIIDGNDIYGDGVNVAARLEALAEPGGIAVSGMVHESLGNRIDIDFSDAGEHQVKNIARPIRLFRWSPRRGIAAYVAERYEECVDICNEALREYPGYASSLRQLTAALAMLGRQDEAKAALDKLLQRMPGLTISQVAKIVPVRYPADHERWLEGLRRAGLPE